MQNEYDFSKAKINPYINEQNEFNQPVGQFVDHWQPLHRPVPNILHGEYCILEPMDIDKHATKLLQNLSVDNNGESWTYLPYGPFNSVNEFNHWLKETMLDKDTLLFTALDAKIREPIGIAGYLRINPEHGSIEVGHLHFSKFMKKTPAATEAMYLMMSYIFDELKYRRYEWKCNALNQASRNAALRLGFKFEGIFRQCNVFKSRNRDTAWFSIIDSEWPEIKNKFEKWLSLDNFDSDGNQIARLQDV